MTSPQVNQLQYVVLGARDLDAWETFAVEMLGMGVSSRDETMLQLRCDRKVARVIVEKSDVEDVIAVGWNAGTIENFEAFIDHFDAVGVTYEEIAGEEARRRGAMRLLRVVDPEGVVQEVAWGLQVNDAEPFVSPVVTAGFNSEELGLGHVFFTSTDLQRSRTFFRKVLNMKTTAHFFVGPAEIVFMRCNARHHTLAFAVSGRPEKLTHLQLELNSFDDVGRAMDRAAKLGIEQLVDIGKHASDWVTSFYVRAPSGLVIEIGWNARHFAEDAPTEFEFFKGSIWGHRHGMEKA